MPVRQDEEIYVVVLKCFAGEHYLMFRFVAEDGNIGGMRGAAAGRTSPCNRKGDAGVQQAVKKAVWSEAEHFLDEKIARLFSAQPVAVPYQATFPVQHKQARPMEHFASETFREIVLDPHIMIPGEEIYVGAALVHFVQQVEQTEIAFRGNIGIFEPKIEDVA